MSRLMQVQIVISSIETGLYKAITDGDHTYIYGTAAWDGRTVDFVYEKITGEYGGSALTWKPAQPEPVDEVVADVVSEECSEIIHSALRQAIDAYDASIQGAVEDPLPVTEEVELDD